MLGCVLLLMLAAAGDPAEPPAPPAAIGDDAERARDAAAATALNRSVLDRHDEARAREARAEAEYQRQLADYEAKRAAADRAKGESEAAAAAYAADRARYEEAMRTWQAESAAGPASRRRPRMATEAARKAGGESSEPAAGKRMVCRMMPVTGSLLRKYRECKSTRDWDNERADIRAPRTTTGGCANFGDKC